MTKEERYRAVFDYFQTQQQSPKTELHYTNPFELIVAVSLSAQCTDKRVNQYTPAIFRDFPTPEALGAASFEILFPYIKSISFPNNKTKNLIAMGKYLVSHFHSQVPESIEDLVKLPGVGRKTANVIASVVYHQPAMAVDTHVFRVSKRIGLVDASLKTPLEVERELVKNIPEQLIADAHHWLILHGRYVCKARTPNCVQCGIAAYCAWFENGRNGAVK